MKVMINQTKAILSGCVVLFTGSLSVYYFANSMYPEAPIFGAIALVFAYLFFLSASTITINETDIICSFFGIKRKQVSWSDVKELGLIGENVFSKKREKTGDKYIYFSPVEMTEKERFTMITKWPPKNMLYMSYGQKQLDYTMTIWGKELKTYNVADLFPDSDDNSPSDQETTE